MEDIIFGCPGSGKTTYIVKRAGEHPNAKGYYLSFGRQNSQAAAKRMPAHIQCMSFHALARKILNIDSSRLVDNMTMSSMGGLLGLLGLRDKTRNLKLLEALTLFYEIFIKTDINLNQVHSIYSRSTQFPPMDREEQATVISLFKSVWNTQTEAGSTAPISHDGYLKQLSLHPIHLDADYVYIDEAQDMDDIMHAICDNIRRNNPGIRMAMLGDPCQQIFGFRRASPRFGMMLPTESLTESHRFGRNIAFELNRFMGEQRLPYFSDIEAHHDADDVIKDASMNSVVARVKAGERLTFITRHNVTVWSIMARMAQQGLSCSVNGSINRNEIRRIKALHALFLNKPQNVYKKTTFERVRSRMEISQNYEGILMCRFIESFSPSYPEIIENLERYIVPANKAHVLLSTTHQAKGLEFKHVVLAHDFSSFYNRESDEYPALSPAKSEDVHVFFTAMSRARVTLTLPFELTD